jgi:hypothetical protein
MDFVACAFNKIYLDQFGVLEKCESNCQTSGGGGFGGIGGGEEGGMMNIIMGGALGVVAILCCGFYYYRRRRGNNKVDPESKNLPTKPGVNDQQQHHQHSQQQEQAIPPATHPATEIDPARTIATDLTSSNRTHQVRSILAAIVSLPLLLR